MQDPTEIQPEPSNDVEIARPTLTELGQPITYGLKHRHPFTTECPWWCTSNHKIRESTVVGTRHYSEKALITLSRYVPWWDREDGKDVLALPHVRVFVVGGLASQGPAPWVMFSPLRLDKGTDTVPQVLGPCQMTPNEAVRVAAALVRAADIAAGTDPIDGQS